MCIATIDLPLVPVLLRMEQAGVRVDRRCCGEMSSRLAVEIDDLAGAAMLRESIGASVQHQFAEAAWAMCCSTRWTCRSR